MAKIRSVPKKVSTPKKINAVKKVKTSPPKIKGVRKGLKTPANSIKAKNVKKPKVTGKQLRNRAKNGFEFQEKVQPNLQRKNGRMYGEVHTKGNTKRNMRIDHVNEKGKPFSVKNTQWDKVKRNTLRRYVNEASKYPGRTIHSRNVPKNMQGTKVKGKPVLVVPNIPIKTKAQRSRYWELKKMANKKGVSLNFQQR